MKERDEKRKRKRGNKKERWRKEGRHNLSKWGRKDEGERRWKIKKKGKKERRKMEEGGKG